ARPRAAQRRLRRASRPAAGFRGPVARHSFALDPEAAMTRTEPSAERPYPDVDPQPSFPAIERRILEFWRVERVFEESVARRPAGRDGANEYVFYDGPPFANGLPHYGHLLTGFVKDVVPRYQTMRGRRVERRFGWDCH